MLKVTSSGWLTISSGSGVGSSELSQVGADSAAPPVPHLRVETCGYWIHSHPPSSTNIGTMEDIENNEPIFELAGECEKLYAEQISRLNDVDDPNGTTFLSELNQRFAAWAAFLGVFAESKICLDHRLRHHIEIQDQVLLLLEIMQRNLTYCAVFFLPRHSIGKLKANSIKSI